ncbi:MAG: hypothetical protein U5L01_04470 [Rheinheimera sp.]|nr:hypothetical protein [Rheinheimera sp.]
MFTHHQFAFPQFVPQGLAADGLLPSQRMDQALEFILGGCAAMTQSVNTDKAAEPLATNTVASELKSAKEFSSQDFAADVFTNLQGDSQTRKRDFSRLA